MKKKLSFLMLAVFILPVLTFFGCGTSETHKISASSSDINFGIVEGQGTYSEGSEITLTATAFSGSSFVGWIFEEQTLLDNGETYSISNTTESDKTKTSTLTFKCTSATKGNYTAVFEDPEMQYAKLSSWYISKTEDSAPESETSLKPVLMQASMSISQGKSVTSEIYSTDAVDIKENVEVEAQTNNVLKLEYGQNYQVKIKPILQIGTLRASPTMIAYLSYKKTSEKVEETGYSYKVTYENGVYIVQFEITISEQTYYINLLYKNLGK